MKDRRESSPSGGLARLGTEQRNAASTELDAKPALEIARIINAQDATVPGTVALALPAIAQAIDAIASAIGRGGRLIYVGAGTSGRLAALDAVECPPTFNTSPKTVQWVIAGGAKALAGAVESQEDSATLGVRDIRRKKPGRKDVVVGLAASGRTPYTIAALEYARNQGATAVAITCNPNSPLEEVAQIAIVLPVGPEVVAGSTRMKAGSAQKLVCNMLTTGAMARLGYVYGNLMVNLHLKNRKLAERGIAILMQTAEIGREAALKALKSSGRSVPVAILMLKTGVGRREAERLLKAAKGNVRLAIERAPGEKP